MPLVTFQPTGQQVVAHDGETVLACAMRHGIHLEHACGGFCACTTCHVLVEEGATSLSEVEFEEEDRLDTCEGLTMRSRLGCQARVRGDVRVRIPPKPY